MTDLNHGRSYEDFLEENLLHFRTVVEHIRTVILGDDLPRGCDLRGVEFDDDHTLDAHKLAKIAEAVGLEVVYYACDGTGCSNRLIPESIKRPDDG